jgi:hypothetical protein
MISKDKTYRTRDGREVRIYATDGDYPFVVHGAIKNEDREWKPCQWLNRGCATIMTQSDRDLIEVKPRIKRTVWLNMYENNVHPHSTKEFAMYCKKDGLLACVKVEIDCEEGEGL